MHLEVCNCLTKQSHHAWQHVRSMFAPCSGHVRKQVLQGRSFFHHKTALCFLLKGPYLSIWMCPCVLEIKSQTAFKTLFLKHMLCHEIQHLCMFVKVCSREHMFACSRACSKHVRMFGMFACNSTVKSNVREHRFACSQWLHVGEVKTLPHVRKSSKIYIYIYIYIYIHIHIYICNIDMHI